MSRKRAISSRAGPERPVDDRSQARFQATATLGPVEAASYIRELTLEMRRLARAHDLALLAFLLDMAQIEAEARARRDTDN